MIHLTIPPDPTAMGVLRATAGAIAARAALTIDQVEDVRMAVEEAGMLLLQAGEPVTMTVQMAGDPFLVEVSVDSSAAIDVDPDSLAWLVLRGMTDHLDLRSEPGRVTLRLRFDPVPDALAG